MCICIYIIMYVYLKNKNDKTVCLLYWCDTLGTLTRYPCTIPQWLLFRALFPAFGVTQLTISRDLPAYAR